MSISENTLKNRPFIVLSVMLATIMQALDTTIANVALPHMQGSLNATQEQISWVLTSYIVAAAIMTAPTGYLASRLGRKRLFTIAVVGFTLASIMCGMAETLPEMVVFRLLQGVFGASLVPLSQAVLLDIYPQKQHGQAMAMWGVGVMLGPILGPTLGGWLTEYYNWRWVFYINVPIGIVATLGILSFMPDTEKDHGRKLDITGFALLSLAIGSLQLMLDRGETKDWFSSPEIMIECGIAILCSYLFLVQIFTVKQPFVQPAMFTDRNYSTSLIFMFVMGVILFGSMALLPPFLQGIMGYPVITTGLMLAPRGIGTMVAMMLVGRLMGKIEVRVLLLFGLSLMAWSLWEMTLFTDSVPEHMLISTGLLQGFGMGFVFIPLSTVAYATLDPRYRNDATAFFSLLRNIGSSIGISIMTSLLAQNIQINHAELSTHLTMFNPAYKMVESMSGNAGISEAATSSALAILNAKVTEQAATISYLNDFRLMLYITLAAMPLLMFMRKPAHKATAEEAAAALE